MGWGAAEPCLGRGGAGGARRQERAKLRALETEKVDLKRRAGASGAAATLLQAARVGQVGTLHAQRDLRLARSRRPSRIGAHRRADPPPERRQKSVTRRPVGDELLAAMVAPSAPRLGGRNAQTIATRLALRWVAGSGRTAGPPTRPTGQRLSSTSIPIVLPSQALSHRPAGERQAQPWHRRRLAQTRRRCRRRSPHSTWQVRAVQGLKESVN